jgi:hypothetical protein
MTEKQMMRDNHWNLNLCYTLLDRKWNEGILEELKLHMIIRYVENYWTIGCSMHEEWKQQYGSRWLHIYLGE